MGAAWPRAWAPPTNQHGWAARLAESLSAPSLQLSLLNRAESGRSTATAADDLDQLLAERNPRVVMLGLSLANEGLLGAPDEATAQQVGDAFKAGLSVYRRALTTDCQEGTLDTHQPTD